MRFVQCITLARSNFRILLHWLTYKDLLGPILHNNSLNLSDSICFLKQLYGGIQRYLEQFPSWGFFKGKNFVFDHRYVSCIFLLWSTRNKGNLHFLSCGCVWRISVGSSKEDIIGCCLLCNNTFDDYSPRCRCRLCRMLVLVCNHCQVLDLLLMDFVTLV